MARGIEIVKAFMRGFDRGVVTVFTRFSERTTMYANWSRPVLKARGEISGDELAHYIKAVGDMPLPNIWASKGEHGSH